MDPELREVKLLRKRLGLTQQQVAAAAGVSQSLIAKVEAGSLDPSFTAGKRILGALHAAQHGQERSANQLMTRPALTCAADARVKDAITTMRRKALSRLPVVEHNQVVGLLSERAILERLDEIDEERTTVRDVMHAAPPMIPGDTPRRVVAELLRHYGLLLVQERGKPAGALTKADLLKTI